MVDPTVPLLAQSWLQDRLVLGDVGGTGGMGRFENSAPGTAASRARGNRIVVDLCKIAAGDTPALTRISDGKIALRYNDASQDEARAALIASASHGGWPIARDTQSLALLTLSERIAASDIPVLLEGPTGTGKEVFARFIHQMSKRSSGAFVAVNCAAMPEAMLEGLLFGHRKGAFTGAAETREGLFRAADGGTLLLDEIGELPLALQAKLLRTLQEGEVLPLGATKPVKVDVRIIAATNRTLSNEVTAGRFREDLYYRLNVFPIVLPALCERVGDIAPLAFGMVLRHGAQRALPSWISSEAIARLEAHNWPGNVRELENVIRRAILLAGDDAVIKAEHVVFDCSPRPFVAGAPGEEATALAAPTAPAPIAPVPAPPLPNASPSSLSDVAFQSEAQAILRALDTHGGHRARTAASLGISERTLRYRLASMRENGLLQTGAEA
ncbi:Fis family transcriptional regulator [Erythrobacter longus]|uniref:Fis family transcriptional regulator n=1 Tax=Erythrobacter longus TaxID=1044 RepID=A0A074M3S0_ERYLO|nr:sigma 54-interacting transcriptional regulator [Erythrobacter longus]KEO89261.1 Fis family transcriptional regulator [Erythrobacter longus]